MGEGTRGGPRPKQTRVLQALVRARTFIGAQDLHRALEESGVPVGLATVYRHLHALVSDGSAEAVRTAQGELFRAAVDSPALHLHLVCDTCGSVDEAQAEDDLRVRDERWLAALSDPHGFRPSRHTLEVHGQCARCG